MGSGTHGNRGASSGAWSFPVSACVLLDVHIEMLSVGAIAFLRPGSGRTARYIPYHSVKCLLSETSIGNNPLGRVSSLTVILWSMLSCLTGGGTYADKFSNTAT